MGDELGRVGLSPHELRKIIHIDMDCFYAAIEIRDRPELKGLPVAVGAPASRRGVLCTCNYEARRYGIHSAMPSATALRHCKGLIILPVDMSKYKVVAHEIKKIFLDYTPLVEPLALDEAYLDVTEVSHHQGSATLMAKEILHRILAEQQLTASAGVASNKFLAKVGSGWNKPNGFCVILPDQAETFAKALPIEKFFGVGKVTFKKMQRLGIQTGADLQKLSLQVLNQHFGKLGERLYEQCRGVDHRAVEANRERKSLSVEQTFQTDINEMAFCEEKIKSLYERLLKRIEESASGRQIKNQYLKIKFADFKISNCEVSSLRPDLEVYLQLLRSTSLASQPIRLLGLGVHFQESGSKKLQQGCLF